MNREAADRLMMARVAAMMLARERPQDIAASVLADSEERLAVSVAGRGSTNLERCLVGCDIKAPCQAEAANPPRPGWPLLFQYTLEENMPDADNAGVLVRSPLLVEAGGDRITYRRVEAETQLNYCYFPSPLAAETRHRLLAEMLGVEDKAMPWQVQENTALFWEYDDQFLRDLGGQVDAEEKTLRATVLKFFAKGLITRSEMDATRPKLAVVVFDDRARANPPYPLLPSPAALDSRTMYRVNRWSM